MVQKDGVLNEDDARAASRIVDDATNRFESVLMDVSSASYSKGHTDGIDDHPVEKVIAEAFKSLQGSEASDEEAVAMLTAVHKFDTSGALSIAALDCLKTKYLTVHPDGSASCSSIKKVMAMAKLLQDFEESPLNLQKRQLQERNQSLQGLIEELRAKNDRLQRELRDSSSDALEILRLKEQLAEFRLKHEGYKAKAQRAVRKLKSRLQEQTSQSTNIFDDMMNLAAVESMRKPLYVFGFPSHCFLRPNGYLSR